MKTSQRRRGTIEARGDRKWLVRVYLYRVEGKRVYSSKTVEGTYKMAEQVLTRMQRELDTDSFVAPSKLLVREFIDQWLSGKGEIGPKTRMDYEDRLRLDVVPFIGQLKLSQVGRATIRSLYASLISERKLSPSTVRHTHRVLSQVFSQAVEDGQLARNPCDGATKSIPQGTRVEARFLTPSDTVKLLESSVASPWYPLWCLMVNTGLRPQEALALKWDDLSGASLAIQRALVQVSREGKWEVRNDMKTDASRRNILLDESVLEALRNHRKRQAAAILAAGTSYRREGFIFANAVGGFLDISNCRKWWYKALLVAKLPKVKLYEGTRHTHASHMLAGGVDVKTAASRLGHSNPTMLLSTYAHVLPQAASAAAGILGTLTRTKEA